MRISSTVTFLLFAATTWAAPCKDLGKGVIDKECDEDKPTCVYRNGGEVVGGNNGHHCAVCINSRQPNNRDQVAPDEGCDENYPVCVGSRQLAANVEGTACAVCFNSIPAAIDPNDVDDGCPPTAPVCVNDAGKSPPIWKPGTNCVSFLDFAGDAPCKDRGKEVIDHGCNADKPTCVHSNGGEVVGGNDGHHCAVCINSRQPNGRDQVAPDEGCDETNRVCVGSQQLAANVEGTACAVCFNSIPTAIDPNDVDDGCPPTAPVCVNDAGKSPAIWKRGTNCVAQCTDTSVSGKDVGCPSRYPACVTADGSDPGQGNAGVKCI